MGYTLDNGSTISQLAYANDLCILASDQDEIQRVLNIFRNSFAGAA